MFLIYGAEQTWVTLEPQLKVKSRMFHWNGAGQTWLKLEPQSKGKSRMFQLCIIKLCPSTTPD